MYHKQTQHEMFGICPKGVRKRNLMIHIWLIKCQTATREKITRSQDVFLMAGHIQSKKKQSRVLFW